MRWRVLGPVEVAGPGAPYPALRPQQRAFLAHLLLNNGQTISVDQLVEALWADEPPASARTQIHGCVSRLRQVVRAAHLEHALTGHGAVGPVQQPGGIHRPRRHLAEGRSPLYDDATTEDHDKSDWDLRNP